MEDEARKIVETWSYNDLQEKAVSIILKAGAD
jgi:hypothetical protein